MCSSRRNNLDLAPLDYKSEAQSHSVELFKILDDSIPAQPPSVVAEVPTHGKVSQDLLFKAAAPDSPVPAIAYHWDFGDGVITDGATLTHAYTHADSFVAHLRVEE